jgi:hypothetical protein
VVLDKPTRDGETELHLLTNVPAKDAKAKVIADLYRRRWTIEIDHLHYDRNDTLYQPERAGYRGGSRVAGAGTVVSQAA